MIKYFMLFFIPLSLCSSEPSQSSLTTAEKLHLLVSIRTGQLKCGGNFYVCHHFVQNINVCYMLRHHNVDPFLQEFLTVKAVSKNDFTTLSDEFKKRKYDVSLPEAEEKYLELVIQQSKHFYCASHIEACARALISKNDKEAKTHLDFLRDCCEKNNCKIKGNVQVSAPSKSRTQSTRCDVI